MDSSREGRRARTRARENANGAILAPGQDFPDVERRRRRHADLDIGASPALIAHLHLASPNDASRHGAGRCRKAELMMSRSLRPPEGLSIGSERLDADEPPLTTLRTKPTVVQVALGGRGLVARASRLDGSWLQPASVAAGHARSSPFDGGWLESRSGGYARIGRVRHEGGIGG